MVSCRREIALWMSVVQCDAMRCDAISGLQSGLLDLAKCICAVLSLSFFLSLSFALLVCAFPVDLPSGGNSIVMDCGGRLHSYSMSRKLGTVPPIFIISSTSRPVNYEMVTANVERDILLHRLHWCKWPHRDGYVGELWAGIVGCGHWSDPSVAVSQIDWERHLGERGEFDCRYFFHCHLLCPLTVGKFYRMLGLAYYFIGIVEVGVWDAMISSHSRDVNWIKVVVILCKLASLTSVEPLNHLKYVFF